MRLKSQFWFKTDVSTTAMLLAITNVQWLEAGDLFLLLSLLYDCIAGAGSKQYIAPSRFLLLVCYGLHQHVLIAKLVE